MISFDWEIVKRGTLETIDAISETNISANNWFIGLTVVADGQLNIWDGYHLFYQKEGANNAKIAVYGNKGTVNSMPTDLTATKAKITFVRRGTEYIVIKAGDNQYIKTCLDISLETAVMLYIHQENVNGKVTNYFFSKETSDITVALREIGKNA